MEESEAVHLAQSMWTSAKGLLWQEVKGFTGVATLLSEITTALNKMAMERDLFVPAGIAGWVLGVGQSIGAQLAGVDEETGELAWSEQQRNEMISMVIIGIAESIRGGISAQESTFASKPSND